MKKAILLILFCIPFIFSAAAGYFNNIMEMDHSYLGDSYYIEAGKNSFSYNISLLKGIRTMGYSLIVGICTDIYDNIEITDIPDSTQSPSPVNVPFIMDNVNVFSLSVPLSLIFRKGNLSLGITEQPSYTDLYSAHYFSNNIDVFSSLRNERIYFYAMIRNITKTIAIGSSGVTLYQTPELIIRLSVPGYISSRLFIEGGIELRAGRNDTRDYQMDYYIYGMSRSVFFDAKFNKLLFGADVFGGKDALYIGYNADDYRIIASYRTGIVSSFKLSAGFDL